MLWSIWVVCSYAQGDTKRTKTVHKTVNPEFNETLMFHGDDTIDGRNLRHVRNLFARQA